MAKIIFITGRQQSGISRYAKEKSLSLSANPGYLATASKRDDDLNDRY